MPTASTVELADAPTQPFDIHVIAIGVDAPLETMVAGGAGLPHDPEPDLAGRALLIKNDLLHDEAQNALALRRGGRGGVPDPRQVRAQDLERATVGLA